MLVLLLLPTIFRFMAFLAAVGTLAIEAFLVATIIIGLGIFRLFLFGALVCLMVPFLAIKTCPGESEKSFPYPHHPSLLCPCCHLGKSASSVGP